MVIDRVARILDPSVQDHADAVRGDGRAGHDQGPGKLADAEDADGLDTGSQDPGRDADDQTIDQPGAQ